MGPHQIITYALAATVTLVITHAWRRVGSWGKKILHELRELRHNVDQVPQLVERLDNHETRITFVETKIGVSV